MSFLQKLHRFFWVNAFCPYCRSLRMPQHGSGMDNIHQWVAWHCFERFSKQMKLPFRVIMGLVWPFRLSELAIKAVRRYGAVVKKQTGQGIANQFINLLWNGLSYKLLPVEYYRYRLYIKSERAQLSDYLLQHEVTALARFNVDGVTENIRRIVADKKAFGDFCEKYRLSSVPILHSILSEMPLKLDTVDNPRCSLFIKQRHGCRGENSMLWRYDSNGNHYVKHPDGLTISWLELTKYLRQYADHYELLIQPCLDNHPVLTGLCGNALASLRVLTALRPDGDTEVIAATFKMPFRPKQIHSTYSLNSPVDLETGRLGTAYPYQPLTFGYNQHPMSKKKITGQTLPDWPHALKLALSAHKFLKGYPFLGWDVALTPTGPLLLETNAGWDVVTMQQPQQKPLGQTRFKDICLMWLQENE